MSGTSSPEGHRRCIPGRFKSEIRLAAAAWIAAALLGAGNSGQAQETAESGYDKVWSIARFYTGDADSFFQSFALSGRLQLDLAYVDGGDDDHSEFNVRRFRFGFKTVFLEDFTLHVEGEFNPQEADPFYRRLTDAYFAWQPSPAAKVKLGKHSAGFTLEGMTSSNRLLTIDRSNLNNNIWFTEEYMPGVSVGGEAKGFVYFVGLFSSGAETREFGDLKGGHFVLLTLGHDFAQAPGDRGGPGVDKALLRVNFVHNDPNPDAGDSFTRPLDDIGSLNFIYERGRWGLQSDLSAATGIFGQSDLWGFMVMPFFRPVERIEWVGRYTRVESAEPNGVRFARYERELVDGRGDRYDEVYLGLNYYWYGHKLKLQNGLQYADMRDEADDGGAYSGWGWTTGFRVSW